MCILRLQDLHKDKDYFILQYPSAESKNSSNTRRQRWYIVKVVRYGGMSTDYSILQYMYMTRWTQIHTFGLTNTAQTHLNSKYWPRRIWYLQCGQRTCFWHRRQEGLSFPRKNVVQHINMHQQFTDVSKLALMPCNSGLYQKNQGTVIGGKLKFFQCSCHWSITFRNRLVVGNSVINLSDICHRWGLNLWLQINPIFSSLYHNHSTNKQINQDQNRYLPQSFMPSCTMHLT